MVILSKIKSITIDGKLIYIKGDGSNEKVDKEREWRRKYK
ncbi:hypothetical protein GCM10008914_01210 [Clostridium tertium]|jgi:hypothetical protein|nr:hypothetical protein [Clostridium tertium]